MITALLAWLVAINPVVRFVGQAGCPSTADVDARLRTLFPTAAGGGDRDVATLEEGRTHLRVIVRRPDGTTLGQRELQRDHSCAELADAVALVVATWESDVHPEFALALPPPVDRPAASSVSSDGAPDRSPDSPPVLQQRTRPADGPTGADLESVATPAPSRTGFDIGAALVAAAAPHTLDGSFESDLVAAVSVVAGWVPHGSGPGARVALGIAADRVIPLASGDAHWRRVTAAVGPQFRFSKLTKTSVLDLHVELIAAGLDVHGQRFSVNGNDWSFDVGAGAGARLWLGTGTWRPWLDLSVAFWPTEHVVYAAPSQEAVSLPKIETLLALGLAFWR